MQFAGLNYFAVIVAAIVSFMFGWLWYGVLFSKQWLRAIGKTEQELKAQGPSPMPFIISFIALVIMSWALAGVVGHLSPGEVSFKNGVISAFFLWLGFVITTMTVNHAFHGTKRAVTLIDGGHWLGVLVLQGAVIGLMGV
jgi:hypothetical protein